MLMMAGQAHRRERKLVMPMFHGDRMRAYAGIMKSAAESAIQAVPVGTSFAMLDVTTEISMRVIVQAIFGGESQQAVQELMDSSRELVRRSVPILFFSPKFQFKFFGLSPWDRFVRSQFALRSLAEQEVNRRKQDPREREDILSMLMEATYEDGSGIESQHLYDELGTFLFAGHETSAIAMAWAMYHLHRNPGALEKLRAERRSCQTDSPSALAQLPYLKAVVQETLRLHPIVTEVLRVLNRPMRLDRFELPAGTAVAPAMVLAHYREDVFPNADEFQPERFLDRNYSSSEYMPFGGGHRRCAGAAFALYEMAIALSTLLSGNEFELLETKPVVPKRRNVTMGPSTGILMRCVC